MLDETLERVSDPDLFLPALAIGSLRHRQFLEQSLSPDRVVLEPIGRNSAPAIAIAALIAEPDETLLILPADHNIGNVPAFHDAIRRASKAVDSGQIVTFGIEPDFPATGYGYIEAQPGDRDVLSVKRFVEKPDEESAKKYIETGGFYWNAGIFMFRADVMIDALNQHAPDILASVRKALGTDRVLDRSSFAVCRSESIDYAVMEAADNISVVPVSMDWSDVGDYRAVHNLRAERTGSQRVEHGPVAAPNSLRAFLHSTGPRVAVHGIDDVAVIATPYSVLVSKLDDAAGIKPVVNALQTSIASQLSKSQCAAFGHYIWNQILPAWAERAIDPATGGAIECLDLDGSPLAETVRRGRVAPRQLYTFAKAKSHGWNPDGQADRMIDALFEYVDGPARSPKGGWAHEISASGSISDPSRHLYDHAFVALAGAQLADLGDPRGQRLAEEAFDFIDDVLSDRENLGWWDTDSRSGGKLANPHMHLLEASLRYHEVFLDSRSAERIETIMTLFERFMFAPEDDVILECFLDDWSRESDWTIEPGHCLEWAFLLTEVERLTGRDCSSWVRRLVRAAELIGHDNGLIVNTLGAHKNSFRLWPQLERLRIQIILGLDKTLVQEIANQIWSKYLSQGPDIGWIDQLDSNLKPASTRVPASMLYHLMTGLAPYIDPPKT
jgi:mannose-1-phosphate guanylyltransferase/mannose/cellobiose epimerase-like protein (N-acyl-D-glucosamine 2-epimerase family)